MKVWVTVCTGYYTSRIIAFFVGLMSRKKESDPVIGRGYPAFPWQCGCGILLGIPVT